MLAAASYTSISASVVTSISPIKQVSSVQNNFQISSVEAQKGTNKSALNEQKKLDRKVDLQVQNYIASRRGAAEGIKQGLLLLSGRVNYVERKASSDEVEIRESKRKSTTKIDNDSSNDDIEIQVEQIAKAQKNTGAKLQSDGINFSSTELFGFNIQVGDKTHNFSISANKNETNDTVLSRMAKAVNDRKIGVTASVVRDKENNTSTLEIAANRTGVPQGRNEMFGVSKRESANQVSYADAVSATGIDRVSQQAQNARYNIRQNDIIDKRESRSNDVVLPQNIAATLRSETTDFVRIEAKENKETAADVAKSIIENINSLYENAKNFEETDTTARRITNEISGLAQTYEKQLDNVGVNRNEMGVLKIDNDRLAKAAGSGLLEQLFQKENHGFASRISKIASSTFDGMQAGFLMEASF